MKFIWKIFDILSPGLTSSSKNRMRKLVIHPLGPLSSTALFNYSAQILKENMLNEATEWILNIALTCIAL